MTKSLTRAGWIWGPLVFVCCLLGACALCGNDVAFEEVSPNGRLKAVVFDRSCGATTGFTTQISILPRNASLPNEGGNVFGAEGVLRIQVSWVSDSQLQVGYPPAKVLFKERRKGGVSIDYEEVGSK